MKQLALILFCLIACFANGQDSTMSTFHVRREAANFNGIAFSYGCGGKHKDVFIDNDGNANFYWGGNTNPTSASFANDTVLVQEFKNIITIAFIDTLNKIYNTDHRCGYFVRVLENGRVVNGAIIDETLTDPSLYVPNKLRVLIKLLDELYNKYSFPKQ